MRAELLFDQLNILREQIKPVASELLPDGTVKKRYDPDMCVDAVLDLLIMAYMYGVFDVNEQLNLQPESALDIDEGIRAGLQQSGVPIDAGTPIAPAQSVDIDKMYRSIYRQIADKDFAERVREYAEEGDEEGILRVAETETTRDYNTGANDAAVSSGLNLRKTWVTMRDERVRATHEPLYGVTVGMDERFYAIDGDSARFPGDFEKPENCINCRCYLIYSIA